MTRFHLLRSGDTLTLARRLPARFDVEASARFPLMSRARLAHLIRQDLWRLLQRLRGFAPVVEATRFADHLMVRAGGQALAPIPARTNDDIRALLHDPALRQRWLR